MPNEMPDERNISRDASLKSALEAEHEPAPFAALQIMEWSDRSRQHYQELKKRARENNFVMWLVHLDTIDIGWMPKLSTVLDSLDTDPDCCEAVLYPELDARGRRAKHGQNNVTVVIVDKEPLRPRGVESSS